jgi:hypothetical protein
VLRDILDSAQVPRMTNTSRVLRCAIGVALLARGTSAQVARPRPPVIDVHSHGTLTEVKRPDTLNLRYRLVTIPPIDLEKWESVDRSRIVSAIGFPCDHGRAPMFGSPCLPNGADLPDTAWVRAQIKAGRIQAFAEIISQYVGMSPADPRLDPYWALAEELDIPVGIHMGFGPPNAAYESSPTPLKTPDYRVVYSNPVLLEEILMRHKKLRIYAMHAAWPLLEPMIAMLYAHPGLYVDVGGLHDQLLVPRASYYRHMRGLVEAGFGKRIMFGSDFQGQPNVARAIDAILTADFLTADQKADILCGNAQRFFRLPEAVCRPEP